MYRLSTIPFLMAEEMQTMHMMRDPKVVFDSKVPSGVQCLERVPRLNGKVWEPFPNDAPERKRRIRIFEMPPLGRGTFGILFAVAMEVPPEKVAEWKALHGDDGGDDVLDPWVVLAAMKMTPILKDHSEELINGLAINDIVRAGCTPNIIRLIDGFCVTTLSDRATCEMPPSEWKDSLWTPFDRFVFTRQDDLIRFYGENIMRPIPDNEANRGRARLSGGATVGFLFTELSTHFLLEMNTVRSDGTTILAEDDMTDALNQGLHSANDLVSKMFLTLQSVDALNAAGLLHMDIHDGNNIDMPTTQFRTDMCFFETRRGRELRYAALGRPGLERPDDVHLHRLGPTNALQFRASDQEDNRSVFVIPKTRNLPTLIDFGKVSRPRFDEGVATHDKLAEYLFGVDAMLDERLPTELPLVSTFSHSKPAYASRGGVAPAVRIIAAPTTNLYTRPFEQLNPFVIPKLRGTSDFAADSHYVAFHSEASEVFSVAACVAKHILGYAPFGRVLRATVPLPNGQVPQTKRSAGPRVTFLKGRSNPTSATAMRQFEMRYSFFSTVVEECKPERSHSEMGTRAKTPQAVAQQQQQLRNSNLLPDLNAEATILHCKPLHDTYDLRTYITRRTSGDDRLRSKPCFFYNYIPKGNQDKTSGDKGGGGDTTADIAEAIMIRIDAVGLPKNLDGLRGTFLYDYLVETAQAHQKKHEQDRDMQRTGWLFHAIYDALRDRWGFPTPLAKDFTHRLLDALSIDPANRPTLQRLMQSDIFKWLLLSEGQQQQVTNVHALWSSIRPNPTTAMPDFLNDRTLANLNKIFNRHPELFSMPPERAREEFGFLDWSRSAHLNVARVQCFMNEHTSIPGFLLRRYERMPRLLMDESGLASFYNYKMGLLDYYTGNPCAVAGKEKFIVLVREERLGGMVHFFNDKTREQFWKVLVRIHDEDEEGGSTARAPRLPAWLFANVDADTGERMDSEEDEASSSSSSSPLSPTFSTTPQTIEGGEIDSTEELVESGSIVMAAAPDASLKRTRDELPGDDRPAKRARTDQQVRGY